MGILQSFAKRILALLGAQELVGGLEVSDYAIRFSLFDGSAWRFAAVRLVPGTMASGEIKDRVKLLSALKELRVAILGKSRKRIIVILSLSSVQIYSEIFSLPLIEGENMEKAIQLNIEMKTPVKMSDIYTGWEIVEKDQAARRLDILSAFIKRPLIDTITDAFVDAGFIIAAVEPKALALSRLASAGGSGFQKDTPAIVLNIDASGMNFIIVRKGRFYFEYPNQWQDVEDAKGNVTMPDFSKAILRSVHQVVNFYAQHWPEEVHDIYIISSVLRDEVAHVIKENFPLTPHFFEFRDLPTLDPQWFVAVGSGIRGTYARRTDTELSLTGDGSFEVYARGRLADFLLFWRIVFPIILGLFLVLITLADFSLASSRDSREARQHATQLSPDALTNIKQLSVDIGVFNASVHYIKNAESSVTLKGPLFIKISQLMESHTITLSRITLSSSNTVFLSGSAVSQSDILVFEKALEGDSEFSQVDLPLNSIIPSNRGVSFSMTFTYIPPTGG